MVSASSQAIIFLTVLIIVMLSLGHVDELVVWLHRVLHVEVLSRRVLLVENCLDDVLEYSPAVLQVQVNLRGKCIRLDADEADNVMRLA